ncbi:DUF3313 domain-containing protein [Methylobacterium iners]|uniref:DUF3313 domain-containing protein n=2 Tax=Methylobacterium iners TaxID=418707 RepID=A0ABQ4RUF1_9HYPH|nr:hypothetical protein OCOJLMKI_0798 [Methylobacterium iners]
MVSEVRYRLGSAALWLSVAVAAAGCATQASTQSGFLRDYSSLRPSSDGSDKMKARIALQAPEAAVLARYRGAYLDPVVITVSGLDAEQTTALAEVMNRSLAEEVGKTWPLVGSPGPGVLRVRTAVTGVTKANVALNVAMTAVATPLSNGGAAAEAEVVDGQTGRRVAALTWADEKRFSGQLGFYSETGHARDLLPEFAAEVGRIIAR